MLRAEDNKFLTESGEGTPMGDLLRRFWLPVYSLLWEASCAAAVETGKPNRARIRATRNIRDMQPRAFTQRCILTPNPRNVMMATAHVWADKAYGYAMI